MTIKNLRASEEVMEYWEKRFSAKSFKKKNGRFVETIESRNKKSFGKQTPLRITSIRYVKASDVEKRIARIQEFLGTAMYEYYKKRKL